MSTSTHAENGGSLAWAIRDSFLRYVTVIARGSFETDGVELDARGRFVFPLRAAARDGDDWHFWFSGSVRLRAHGGLLDVRIVEPEIVLGLDGGIISTRAETGLLPIAVLDAVQGEEDGFNRTWQLIPARLLESGVPLFGDVYPAETEMAPLSIGAALVHS